MKQEHVGSDFDGFLKQNRLLAECEAGALKRVVAWQNEREMKVISRARLADRTKPIARPSTACSRKTNLP